MLQGYEPLREDAALLDLSARGRIRVTGRDRVRLLHNLTTNNIKELTPGQGCYAFLLTPQGRIQADLNIFCYADHFLLDTEPETRERVLTFVRKYIIADDVTLEDVTDALCCLAVEGPRAAAVLEGCGAPAPSAPWSHAEWGGVTVAAVSSTGQPAFRIFAPAERKPDLAARLESAGASPASPEAARLVRLENGMPRYGEDISDTTLPQETRQMHAVSFNKGCYLGQEIVERIRARGHVNRLFSKLLVEGNEAPAPGTKVEANGTEAGEITSAAFLPSMGKVVALAYLRAQHARPGVAFTVMGRPAVAA
jgi:aminomethyltransferase